MAPTVAPLERPRAVAQPKNDGRWQARILKLEHRSRLKMQSLFVKGLGPPWVPCVAPPKGQGYQFQWMMGVTDTQAAGVAFPPREPNGVKAQHPRVHSGIMEGLKEHRGEPLVHFQLKWMSSVYCHRQ